MSKLNEKQIEMIQSFIQSNIPYGVEGKFLSKIIFKHAQVNWDEVYKLVCETFPEESKVDLVPYVNRVATPKLELDGE